MGIRAVVGDDGCILIAGLGVGEDLIAQAGLGEVLQREVVGLGIGFRGAARGNAEGEVHDGLAVRVIAEGLLADLGDGGGHLDPSQVRALERARADGGDGLRNGDAAEGSAGKGVRADGSDGLAVDLRRDLQGGGNAAVAGDGHGVVAVILRGEVGAAELDLGAVGIPGVVHHFHIDLVQQAALVGQQLLELGQLHRVSDHRVRLGLGDLGAGDKGDLFKALKAPLIHHDAGDPGALEVAVVLHGQDEVEGIGGVVIDGLAGHGGCDAIHRDGGEGQRLDLAAALVRGADGVDQLLAVRGPFKGLLAVAQLIGGVHRAGKGILRLDEIGPVSGAVLAGVERVPLRVGHGEGHVLRVAQQRHLGVEEGVPRAEGIGAEVQLAAVKGLGEVVEAEEVAVAHPVDGHGVAVIDQGVLLVIIGAVEELLVLPVAQIAQVGKVQVLGAAQAVQSHVALHEGALGELLQELCRLLIAQGEGDRHGRAGVGGNGEELLGDRAQLRHRPQDEGCVGVGDKAVAVHVGHPEGLGAELGLAGHVPADEAGVAAVRHAVLVHIAQQQAVLHAEGDLRAHGDVLGHAGVVGDAVFGDGAVRQDHRLGAVAHGPVREILHRERELIGAAPAAAQLRLGEAAVRAPEHCAGGDRVLQVHKARALLAHGGGQAVLRRHRVGGGHHQGLDQHGPVGLGLRQLLLLYVLDHHGGRAGDLGAGHGRAAHAGILVAGKGRIDVAAGGGDLRLDGQGAGGSPRGEGGHQPRLRIGDDLHVVRRSGQGHGLACGQQGRGGFAVRLADKGAGDGGVLDLHGDELGAVLIIIDEGGGSTVVLGVGHLVREGDLSPEDEGGLAGHIDARVILLRAHAGHGHDLKGPAQVDDGVVTLRRVGEGDLPVVEGQVVLAAHGVVDAGHGKGCVIGGGRGHNAVVGVLHLGQADGIQGVALGGVGVVARRHGQNDVGFLQLLQNAGEDAAHVRVKAGGRTKAHVDDVRIQQHAVLQRRQQRGGLALTAPAVKDLHLGQLGVRRHAAEGGLAVLHRVPGGDAGHVDAVVAAVRGGVVVGVGIVKGVDDLVADPELVRVHVRVDGLIGRGVPALRRSGLEQLRILRHQFLHRLLRVAQAVRRCGKGLVVIVDAGVQHRDEGAAARQAQQLRLVQADHAGAVVGVQLIARLGDGNGEIALHKGVLHAVQAADPRKFAVGGLHGKGVDQQGEALAALKADVVAQGGHLSLDRLLRRLHCLLGKRKRLRVRGLQPVNGIPRLAGSLVQQCRSLQLDNDIDDLVGVVLAHAAAELLLDELRKRVAVGGAVRRFRRGFGGRPGLHGVRRRGRSRETGAETDRKQQRKRCTHSFLHLVSSCPKNYLRASPWEKYPGF